MEEDVVDWRQNISHQSDHLWKRLQQIEAPEPLPVARLASETTPTETEPEQQRLPLDTPHAQKITRIVSLASHLNFLLAEEQRLHNRQEKLTKHPLPPLPVATELVKQEMQKDIKLLEQTIFVLQDDLKCSKQRENFEESISKELQQLTDSMQEKSTVPPAPKNRLEDLQTSLAESNAHYIRLKNRLDTFLIKYFPAPADKVPPNDIQKYAAPFVTDDETEKLESLHVLVNAVLQTYKKSSSKQDYLSLDQLAHWPPYVDLLVRSGVVERHPTKPNMIRLVDLI